MSKILFGNYCRSVRKYEKKNEEGMPAIIHASCGYLELNACAGRDSESLIESAPLCWVCSLKKEVLLNSDLTDPPQPIKICGIKEGKIPQELLLLNFIDIKQKSEKEIKDVNSKLDKYFGE